MTDGLLYFVMPYVEGETLRERLTREGRIPLDETVRIVSEVADALSRAHEAGIVHRDVKPENILLEGGHALVSDFGVSRAVDAAGGDRLTRTGVDIGTPAYMSPEQAGGEAEEDARTDVYALGCVWGDAPPSADLVNWGGNAIDGTVPVGSYPPNARGLYDMAGNIWRFTSDRWQGSYA